MSGPTVFLSYARENVKEIEQLYGELLDAGIQPWMDTRDILPGQDWELMITRAIRRADFFIACISTQATNKRGFVQREIRQALDLWNEKQKIGRENWTFFFAFSGS